jgi:hypothetical protein
MESTGNIIHWTEELPHSCRTGMAMLPQNVGRLSSDAHGCNHFGGTKNQCDRTLNTDHPSKIQP